MFKLTQTKAIQIKPKKGNHGRYHHCINANFCASSFENDHENFEQCFAGLDKMIS